MLIIGEIHRLKIQDGSGRHFGEKSQVREWLEILKFGR